MGFEFNDPWKVSVLFSGCVQVWGSGKFVLIIWGGGAVLKVFLSRGGEGGGEGGGFISYSLLCTTTRRIHVLYKCD